MERWQIRNLVHNKTEHLIFGLDTGEEFNGS